MLKVLFLNIFHEKFQNQKGFVQSFRKFLNKAGETINITKTR